MVGYFGRILVQLCRTSCAIFYNSRRFRDSIISNDNPYEENGPSDDKSYDSFDDQVQSDKKFSEKHKFEDDENDNMATSKDALIEPHNHQLVENFTDIINTQVFN